MNFTIISVYITQGQGGHLSLYLRFKCKLILLFSPYSYCSSKYIQEVVVWWRKA